LYSNNPDDSHFRTRRSDNLKSHLSHGSDSFSALGRGRVILLDFPMVLFEAWQIAKFSFPDAVVRFSVDSFPSAFVWRRSASSELLELQVSWMGFLMSYFCITSGLVLWLTLLR
jgi:hypothetical protein